MYGEAGADTLYGKGRGDRLSGTAGGDILNGGGGADGFVIGKENVVGNPTASVTLAGATDTGADFSGSDGCDDLLNQRGVAEHASFTRTKLTFIGTGAFTNTAGRCGTRRTTKRGRTIT